MDTTKVIPIHQAKTNLSQLVKEAQAGKTIYIGAYGQPQAVLSPPPTRQPIIFGLFANEPKAKQIDWAQFEAADQDIIEMFENSGHDLDAEYAPTTSHDK